MQFEKAHRTDDKKITDLTIRSKNYWNYGNKQIKAWNDDLTVTSTYIDDNQVYKLTINDIIVGFYAFQPKNENTAELDFLFIEPKYIGKGYGKILMTDFLKRIKETSYEKVTLDADPNAEKFYKKIGFKVVGKLETSIKDRFLPIMEMEIKPV